MVRKYTYDELEIFIDRSGYCGGCGATSKRAAVEMFERMKQHNPQHIHLVIRRPDNTVLAFYHPVLAKEKEGE